MFKRLLKITIISALFLPFIASAANNSLKSVYVAEGELVSGNLITSSQDVTIDGAVSGDLMVFSNSLTVNGRVDGDIIAITQNAFINGEVGGNVRIAASYININGAVARNVSVLGFDLLTDKDANIAWDLNARTKSAKINGVINGSVDLKTQTAVILGKINKNLKINLSKQSSDGIILDKQALVNGDLNYSASESLNLDTKIIAGEINFSEQINQFSNYFNSRIWQLAFSFFSTIIIGLVLILVFPKQVNELFSLFKEKPVKSFLVGILTLILTPIISLILIVSVVGAPLSVLMLSLYLALFLIAKSIIAIILGKLGLNLILKNKKFHWFWSLCVGALLISILFLIPYLAYLFKVLSLSFGMGLISTYAYYQSKNI